MKSPLITTTNCIENAEIEKYIELIATNVVVGTNLFSDFAASFTDLFGGYSNTYQNKLDKVYNSAVEALQIKASRIGADAVIGVKMDFGEISGKNKSMFMVSAVGMAVKLKQKTTDSPQEISDNISISQERLSYEITRRIIIDTINKDKLPTTDQWNYLLNNPIDEIASILLSTFLITGQYNESMTERKEALLTNFPQYIGLINRDTAIKLLYEKIEEGTIKLIKDNKLFDPQSVLNLINTQKIHEAIACLPFERDLYCADDLSAMEIIATRLKNLPDVGKIESVKGVFKESEKFICKNGHKNSVDKEFCTECGINIKGLNCEEVENINAFYLKIETLRKLLQ